MKEGSAAYKLRQELVEAARAYKAEGHSHKEVAEKFGKSEVWSQTWCKGIASQEHNGARMRNQFTSGSFDRVENAKRIIAKHHPEYEYVEGFVSVDGPVVIRCKRCGATITRSMITLRHNKLVICPACEKNKKDHVAEEKARIQIKDIQKRLFNQDNRSKQLSMQFCEACGVLIPAHHNRKFCSACSENNKRRYANEKNERRRIAAHTKQSASITLAGLYERDNGICWLCGKPCDITRDRNDNLYPSIDHVLPISKGGKDEWSNIKLAHRICNSIKFNKIV